MAAPAIHGLGVEASPAVSIVVVTYNHEAFIEECLESCVAQARDYPALEIVVADDGSRDNTPKLINSWARRYPRLFRPVLASSNSGIASNFNRGLSAARGVFIAWLGGDDILLPGKIRQQAQFLASRPSASGCYHDAEVFSWPSGEVLGLFSALYAGRAAHAREIDARKMLDPRYQMLPSTVMVRRDRLPSGFDTRLHFHNDYLFDLETIVRGGPYVRMEGVLTRYRKHEKSIGQDPFTRKIMLEENLMVAAIAEARFPRLASSISRRAIYCLSVEIVRNFAAGDRRRGRDLCRALFVRRAWTRGCCLYLFGGFFARLAQPKYRRLAVRLRAILG